MCVDELTVRPCRIDGLRAPQVGPLAPRGSVRIDILYLGCGGGVHIAVVHKNEGEED